MQSEIIPLHHSRKAWNEIHGTQLEHHNGLLSREQAQQINDAYDIEIYLGTHGLPLEADEHDFKSRINAPTPLEYQEVENMIATLQPGDILFLELGGFSTTHRRFAHELSRISSEKGEGRAQEVAARLRKVLEAEREERKLDAWDYAGFLADIKGIRVVPADYDAFDFEAVKAISTDERDMLRSDDVEVRRDLAARNILKDAALEGLSSIPLKQDTLERKPKLVMLRGSAHAETLEEVFADIHLDAKMIHMQETPFEERLKFARKESAAAFRQRLGRSVVGVAQGILGRARSKRRSS